MIDAHVFDITRVIQLAVAPVFLLTAIGTIINALTTRLGRATDRRRTVESDMHGEAGRDDETHARLVKELKVLMRRTVLVLWAIGFAVFSALLVCLLIGTAFVGAFISLDLSRTVAILFIAAVASLTLCLVLFMREVFLAAFFVDPDFVIRRVGSRG